MNTGEAKWTLVGVVVGSLLTGIFSVYVEIAQRTHDDVRYRVDMADEILQQAAEAANIFQAREIGVVVRFVQKVALSHVLPNPLLLRG